MAARWSVKRFTRVDVLIVVVLSLLVIGAMQPLFSRMRTRAIRTGCGANLARIGKAMSVYANDNEGALPRAGGPTTVWGQVWNWAAPDRHEAFALATDGSMGRASINSCFYLLAKHYQVPPKSFVCRGDKGTTEFRLSDPPNTVSESFRLTDAWDFGSWKESFRHCSYSYHLPFGFFRLTTSCDPNFAVAADRNPFLKSPAAGPKSCVGFKPDLPRFQGTEQQGRHGNAIAHREEGQNVLFLDGRVRFETRAYCGLDSDNIYLHSNYSDRGSIFGSIPSVGLQPSNKRDSVLVQDPDIFPCAGPPPGYSR